jgi:hypothetical protein
LFDLLIRFFKNCIRDESCLNNLINIGALWYKLSSKLKNPEDNQIENAESGTCDISGNWQPFLNDWFDLV